MKDSIYAYPVGEISAFQFDERVARVFPDMIARSVPGYSTIITAIGLLAKRYAQPNSYCYDLGCSLGAATLAICDQLEAENCRVIAVDSSEAMAKKFRETLTNFPSRIPVDILCSDIRDMAMSNASVVVLNFTLQFIPINDRLVLLEKIYHALLPGGILVLSEKLTSDDERQNALQTDMHHLFKKTQGYSDLEISQKRTALENILIPETFPQHQTRLKQAGFSSAEIWFQYFNFASLTAFK